MTIQTQDAVPNGLDYILDREQATREAKDGGLTVHVADDTTLQIDADTPEARDHFNAILPRLVEFFGVTRAERTTSRNGNAHYHIHLAAPLDLTTRIALQAVAGSDPMRELLNLVRVQHKGQDPVLLFERPEAARALIYDRTTGYTLET